MKARNNPVYRLGLPAVENSLRALDTFVPDGEVEKTNDFIVQAVSLVRNRDEGAFESTLREAPDYQRAALLALSNADFSTADPRGTEKLAAEIERLRSRIRQPQ
jgi:hypothetical protein